MERMFGSIPSIQMTTRGKNATESSNRKTVICSSSRYRKARTGMMGPLWDSSPNDVPDAKIYPSKKTLRNRPPIRRNIKPKTQTDICICAQVSLTFSIVLNTPMHHSFQKNSLSSDLFRIILRKPAVASVAPIGMPIFSNEAATTTWVSKQ